MLTNKDMSEKFSEYLSELNLDTPVFENRNGENLLKETADQKAILSENKTLDSRSIRKMFDVWVYKLLHDLDGEHHEMLQFFDLPKQPTTDSDFYQLITALKIIEHCSASVDVSSIWLLGISVFLMWFLRMGGKFVGQHVLGIENMENQDQEEWDTIIDKKVEELNCKINDESYLKKTRFRYLSYQVQTCYDMMRKQNDFELPSRHPVFSTASEMLSMVSRFFREMYTDPTIRKFIVKRKQESSPETDNKRMRKISDI
jgi:hypothetical protein